MAQIYKFANRTQRVSVPIHRPFTICYFYSAEDSDKDEDIAQVTRCASELGCIRSAILRIAVGKYHKAIAYDEDQVVKYRFTRRGNKIEIMGIFFEYETWLKMVERQDKLRAKQRKSV